MSKCKSIKDERRAERNNERAELDNKRACEARDAHMKTYETEWYTNRLRSGNYSSWLKTLIELSQACKGSKPDARNLNVCEEDIGDLSDILYQLNLDPLGVKKGGSKQTGGAVTSALLAKLNGWISKHQGEISNCAQYFLEKIYGAISKMINEATFQKDSHTFQFLITLISKLNQDVQLPHEFKIKRYIQGFLFQNIPVVSALQELSLRDLAYYILLGINLFQYVDPVKDVFSFAVDTILDINIDFIGSKEFLNLLYKISQSGLLTASLLLNVAIPSDKQEEIKNIYILIDHNIDRIVAGYIRSGVKNIDNKIKVLITSNNAILLRPLDEHLKQTFINNKIEHSFEKAKIINEIQIEKVNISDATLVRSREDEITRLKGELSNLKTQLIAVLPPGPALPPPAPPAPPVLPPPLPPQLPPRGGKRGKFTRRKIGSRKNKRVQKKKSTKKR